MATSAVRTEQLYIYICSKMANDPSFGSVKLNKAFYYIDNISYLRRNKAISTFSYVRQINGPVPAELMNVQKPLISSGKVEIQSKEIITGTIKKKPVALVQTDVSVFLPEEVQLIDEVIEMLRDFSGKEISDYSHEALAWQNAKTGEPLPLFTFLLTEADISESDYSRADKFIQRYLKKHSVKD